MPNILITAGPTQEFIDPIRYITNSASGKQGYAIADYMSEIGWNVKLVSGPVLIKPQKNYDIFHVKTANEMLKTCMELLPVDVAIFTAAVTDWCPKYYSQKIKKSSLSSIEITYNEDIVQYISTKTPLRPKLVIGFALETENVIENAKTKLNNKKCDWIIANNLMINKNNVLGSEYNQITIITKEENTSLPIMTKAEIAIYITKKVFEYLSNHKSHISNTYIK